MNCKPPPIRQEIKIRNKPSHASEVVLSTGSQKRLQWRVYKAKQKPERSKPIIFTILSQSSGRQKRWKGNIKAVLGDRSTGSRHCQSLCKKEQSSKEFAKMKMKLVRNPRTPWLVVSSFRQNLKFIKKPGISLNCLKRNYLKVPYFAMYNVYFPPQTIEGKMRMHIIHGSTLHMAKYSSQYKL